ncbi:hypothetical protein SMKI_04G6480 [Saccharomyces mikatae IFO 1815]|uniref:Alkyl hydroperoxide reductase subunit C/ Thiol specific antioxidant domain-containing protein n=1 Tax=Saccharomyces mikatae IFO 1815 TaxID=226126 RepID=A0AA35IYX4_SACMI|nr:uncharacterized protein SMKI_04G6480 [Saccharomyces mikatae IFO 1815]CAI4038306.1 hypothetical protein SMKI_04G6480 [Saccharomyces mikatae IFO 1815]
MPPRNSKIRVLKFYLSLLISKIPSWHELNLSRKDGGLGPVKVPLLADTNHTLSRNYGDLIEEEEIALRGLFIIDPKGFIRHITINDLSVVGTSTKRSGWSKASSGLTKTA